MKRYFSKEEDEILTSLVLSYNCTKDERKKESLEKLVFARTELLIYLIPKAKGYLEEEYLAEFFFQQRAYVREMVSAYVLTRLSYIDYLAVILRKRAMTFLIKEKEKEEKNGNLVYEIGKVNAENMISDSTAEYDYDKNALVTVNPDRLHLYDNISMKSIINSMSEQKKNSNTDKERKQRYRILMFLLSVPRIENPELIAKLSDFLSVNQELLFAFFKKKDELCSYDEKKIDNLRAIIFRHYRIRLNLLLAKEKEGDEKRIEKLSENAQKLLSAEMKRRKELSNLKRGLSHREIAQIMDVSRSLVSLNIKKAKAYLEKVLENNQIM